jgi:hypothetical protein
MIFYRVLSSALDGTFSNSGAALGSGPIKSLALVVSAWLKPGTKGGAA